MNARQLSLRLLKAASIFVVLAGVVVLLRFVEPNVEFFSRLVDRYLRGPDMLGPLAYVVITALCVCVGIPRQILAFTGGYAFGIGYGFLWASVGLALSCTLTFNYARFLGQNFVQRRFGTRIEKLERFLEHNPFLMAFIIRSLPVGNNLITNILAGVSRIPALPFILGSALGYMPQTLIFSLLGGGLHVDTFWQIVVSGALFVLASALGLILYRRYSHEI